MSFIAAYDRCDSPRRLLASIVENFDRREADYEVIVANNYYEVVWNRLTEEFFRARHRLQGASRYLYKRQSLSSIPGNLSRALGGAYGWYSLCGVARKRYRAKGRIFHCGGDARRGGERLENRAARLSRRDRSLSL